MEPFWPVSIVPGPEGGDPGGYGPGPHLGPSHHPSLELHMGQHPNYSTAPYYRKHGAPDELMGQPNPNGRYPGSPWAPIQHGFGAEQQWRHAAPEGVMEMRKEKSRDAARNRRGKENHEFYELAKMLPLPAAITTQLDKASIIRLTISYLKLREFTKSGDPQWAHSHVPHKALKGMRGRGPACSPLEMFDMNQGTHILQSLDGFAFTLAADGRFLYISETVSIYLGLSQVEMAGSSVFEYIHQDDHQELADQLELTLTSSTSSSTSSTTTSTASSNLVNSSLTASSSPSSLASDDGGGGGGGGGGSNSQMVGTMNPDVASPMTLGHGSLHKGYDRAFCIRMKSTLTKRGCHFKSSGYRVVLVIGHLRPQLSYTHQLPTRKSNPNLMGMVGLAIALPSPSVNELRLESDMFVTRINFDFKLAHCEPKVSDLLQYTPEELLGRSLYSLCHAMDVEILRKTHKDLLSKGQVMSPYYRLLNKTGGYVWVQTCATVICNSKSSEDQNTICVNYVLSGPLDDSVILDHYQLDPKLGGVKTDPPSDYNPPQSPDKTGTDTPPSHSVDSPNIKPPTPSLSLSGGDCRTPPHMDHQDQQPHHHQEQHMIHDSLHESQLHESHLHDSHNHLHDNHNQLHDNHNQLHDNHNQLHDNHNQLHDTHNQLHDAHNQLHDNHNQLHDTHNQLHDNHNQLHDTHNQLHDNHHQLHDTRSTLRDSHNTMHDSQHDLRRGSLMDQDPHIPHGAPLTPQLTPVSQVGGNITPIVSGDSEAIKTESGGPILTPLTVPDSLDDPHRGQKLSPMTPQSHLQYSSLSSHATQLSPASHSRYSPHSHSQLSPSTQYTTMERLPSHDLDGSVRHLEAAMTRHLPQQEGGIMTAASNVNSSGIGSVAGGFSAIQWAGGQDTSSSPPSAIIRQLYSTKRETVIKTSRDPQEGGNAPCTTTPGTTTSIITSLPSSTSGMLAVSAGYPGYHISPPSSVSPDRLKSMTCDPYNEVYNTPVYTNNPVPSKPTYENLNWYSP